jgi:hypothetical protein
LPAKYNQLQEMFTSSYPDRTDQNVIDSDGTLVLSRGPLTASSALVEELAKKHKKPVKHIDLEEFRPLAAAHLIIIWIDQESIEVLNVAGPGGSKDLDIYRDTKEVIRGVIKLAKLGDILPFSNSELFKPSSVEEAVANLASCLSLKGKTQIAGLLEEDITYLLPFMGAHVKAKLLQWGSNKELMKSCAKRSGKGDMNADAACFLILETLWRHLRSTDP